MMSYRGGDLSSFYKQHVPNYNELMRKDFLSEQEAFKYMLNPSAQKQEIKMDNKNEIIGQSAQWMTFPQGTTIPQIQQHDETMRDRFAMAALTGMLGSQDFFGDMQSFCRVAYEYADAMIEARKKETE
jgi:hypothetical protein